MFDAFREVKDGVVVRIRAVPSASKTALDGYDEWTKSLRFKTMEPAEKGRANRSILDFFASLTGREAVLLSGTKSRDKKVLVLGATLEEVRKRLG